MDGKRESSSESNKIQQEERQVGKQELLLPLSLLHKHRIQLVRTHQLG
jgi:hypothetical protein